ncbi:MAG: hypothetical protein KGH94_01390 [Candidatus Micrarchaeota archaeon]|nr:hypothetical protein [Candidatus Micrarchaeota archaeon]
MPKRSGVARRAVTGLSVASAALMALRGGAGTDHETTKDGGAPQQFERKTYDLQSGLLIKDDTECVEAVVTALPSKFSSGKLLRQIDYVINGRTDKDRLYQFGLEYSFDGKSDKFKLAAEVYQGSTIVAPSYRNDFYCKPYDKVELKLTIGKDGTVEMTAKDLDGGDTVPVETLSFKEAGRKFVGWKEGDVTGTSVFTEAYSTNSVVHVPRQHYTLLKPDNMTNAKFFTEETEWSSMFVTNSAGGLSYLGDNSYRIVAEAESNWLAAAPRRDKDSMISTNGAAVLWSSVYEFTTCNSWTDGISSR